MNQTEENWLMSTVVGASILYIEATDYIHQMSKGGKTGVGHDYVRDMARSLGGDYCSALKSIRDAARKRGDSKLFNDAKATYKQDCRGYGN